MARNCLRLLETVTGKVACLLTCLALAAPAAASELQMQFTRLGSNEGLSQGAINVIVQDQRGFVWMGTEDGLVVYDGYQLEHIFRDRKSSNGLPSNWVSSLAVGRDGRLWIGTDGGGVVWHDPVARRFESPTSADGKPLLDPEARIRQVIVDQQGRLWAATRTSGVHMLDLAAGRAQQFSHDPASDVSLSNDSVFRIAEGHDGSLWIGTLTGLDRLDITTGRIERYGPRLKALARQDRPVQINALHLDQRGLLWVGTNSGLVRFDTSSGEMELMRHRPTERYSLPSDRILSILEDDERRLWVGTAAGLALLDRRTGLVNVFRRNAADTLSLPDDNVITLYQDHSGLLWVGTKFGGAAMWNPRSWSFGHRQLGAGESDNVAGFVEDRAGTLWVGTFGNGLYAIDRGNGIVRRYEHEPGRADGIGDNNVMALAVDTEDRIWIGTMNAGVERLDPRTGTIKRFLHDARNPQALAAAGVMSLMRDSQGRIWVGTYGGGLNRIDPESDRVHRYPLTGDGALSNDRATALAEDRTGLIWIGTDGGGVNVLDPVSGRIRHYLHDPNDRQSLSGNTIYTLHEDERGRMWVGTRGGGFDRVTGAPFSDKGLAFQNFSEADGLPNSTVYGIESDRAGNLWISTNRGLAKFDPEQRTFRNFRRSHGLQADEFNFGAHYRSSSGELFFGGPRGFNAFVAERLRFNDIPPPVVLTALTKLNRPVDVSSWLASGTPIPVAHSEDAITFKFAALDYTDPAANRYQYMLEGFDADWVDAGNTRQATYTNLEGGRYVFRVRAANSDGRWNEQGLSIPLDVEHPPWLRWWALAAYAALFLLILYAVWAGQQRRLREEAAYAQRLSDEVHERTAELAERNRQLQEANTQLREASVTDALTGVGNRRSLRDVVTAVLEAEQDERGRTYEKTRLVLMIIDLDRLKPVNDEFGHEAGDKVLQQVAQIVAKMCRGSDHVSRWGGDEFVVLLKDADLAAASALAERIRESVARRLFPVGDGEVARTSCSIGFATFPFIVDAPGKLGWEQTLALADAALYQAKRHRNMWVGWAGTVKAADVEDLLQAIETDAETLEKDGAIQVRRRAIDAEGDTVDRLLSLGTPTRDR